MRNDVGHAIRLGLLGLAGVLAGFALGRGSRVIEARPVEQAPAGGISAADRPARGNPPQTDDDSYRMLDQQYQRFKDIDDTYALVARSVSPAVVHIVSKKTGRRDDGQVSRFEETGSGVIVNGSDRGSRFVLTNNHVVEGALAREVSIFLHDGRVLHPTQIWSDRFADVAVLKLDRADLPAARLGDSDKAPVGTWVLAMGSPFGLTQSVSQGIISARGRYEQELEDDGVEHQEFLQTDAAINPGNSGGPLVNMRGEVIGINTAIASKGGGSEGVGFSIPINLAKWAMEQLLATGHVERGAIGVSLDGISPQEASDLGLESPRGARVVAVPRETPAAKAGLVPGDVILRFNEIDIHDINHLINVVSMTPIGRASRIQIWRDRKPLTLEIMVADRETIAPTRVGGAVVGAPSAGPLRRAPRPGQMNGLDVVAITSEEQAKRYDLPIDARGVLVLRVNPRSPLSAWLKSGDVVESYTGASEAPKSFADIETAEKQFAHDQPFDLIIRRRTPEGYIPLTIRTR